MFLPALAAAPEVLQLLFARLVRYGANPSPANPGLTLNSFGSKILEVCVGEGVLSTKILVR
jgi:hypothetical protein